MNKVLIKTYAQPSGLWYLALSLFRKLDSEDCTVKFLQKSKYQKDGKRFKRIYPEVNVSEIDSKFFLPANTKYSIEKQIIQHILEQKADTLISFETLMETGSWISEVKRKTGIKIIDIPMVEWITPKIFKSGGYNVFDEIWTVNEFTYDIFKKQGYSNILYKPWNFVDPDLFFPLEKNREFPLKFYHQASINSEYSSKNTDLVVKAFAQATRELGNKIHLNISGKVQMGLKKLIDKHTNICLYNGFLTRLDVAEIYRNSDCIIAPSSREGLGLSFFEAKACNCDLITTNFPPMNLHQTKYLCQPKSLQENHSLIPNAILDVDTIYRQIIKLYEDKKCQIQKRLSI